MSLKKLIELNDQSLAELFINDVDDESSYINEANTTENEFEVAPSASQATSTAQATDSTPNSNSADQANSSKESSDTVAQKNTDKSAVGEQTAKDATSAKSTEDSEDLSIKQNENIVFIGPSSAGKTAVLCSFRQAVEFLDKTNQFSMGTDEDSMSLYIDGADKDGDLLQQLLNKFQGNIARQEQEAVSATSTVNEFSFKIVKRKTIYSKEKVLQCKSTDAKGGSLFAKDEREHNRRKDEAQRKQLITNAAQADHIILCVDSTKEMDEFHKQIIPMILDEIILEQKKLNPNQNTLNVKSFIILLTKADRIAEITATRIREERESSRVTAHSIIDFIDPIEQVKESLGLWVLKTIHSKLNNPSKEKPILYIGLTSAWGFDKNGYPIANDIGDFRFWVDPRNNNEPVDQSPSSPAQYRWFRTRYLERRVLDEWRPYGVKDLIRFLLDSKSPSERFIPMLGSDLKISNFGANSLLFEEDFEIDPQPEEDDKQKAQVQDKQDHDKEESKSSFFGDLIDSVKSLVSSEEEDLKQSEQVSTNNQQQVIVQSARIKTTTDQPVKAVATQKEYEEALAAPVNQREETEQAAYETALAEPLNLKEEAAQAAYETALSEPLIQSQEAEEEAYAKALAEPLSKTPEDELESFDNPVEDSDSKKDEIETEDTDQLSESEDESLFSKVVDFFTGDDDSEADEMKTQADNSSSNNATKPINKDSQSSSVSQEQSSPSTEPLGSLDSATNIFDLEDLDDIEFDINLKSNSNSNINDGTGLMTTQNTASEQVKAVPNLESQSEETNKDKTQAQNKASL